MPRLRSAVCLPLFALGLSAQSFILPPDCELAFRDIARKGLAIDDKCSADGSSDTLEREADRIAKKLESNAKNNFCAAGKKTPITYQTFINLESASTDAIRKTIKTDRAVLKKMPLPGGQAIGEGTLVQFVAYLLDAHYSNMRAGELVNCKTPGKEWNDIHIELVNSAAEDDACNSVAAEMSPHLRPESWADLPDLSLKRPVRVTGPLFFDGSHRPCRDGKRPSPNRISVWEIHPVYQFEVCKNKSRAKCKVTDDAAWVRLDQWHSHLDEEAAEQ